MTKANFLQRFSYCSALVLIALVCSASAWAQTSSGGTVSGEVTDSQGARVAGVEIELLDPTTNISSKSVSNEAGRYIFTNLQPHKYRITFSKAGFSTKRLDSEDVQVGQILTINEVMEIGTISTVVEVTTAPGAELQTANATVGTTVSGTSLINLPIFGSDSSSLALIQPGVSPDGAVAGAMYDQNTFQLDGGNNSNDMDGSMRDYTGSYGHNAFAGAGAPPSGVLPTPPDTIEEFKVNTAGQTADFNGASGSQIQMVTKRGTNDFHGTGYWYYHSTDVGGANYWDNNHTPSGSLPYTPITIAHDNRYGGTVGGPMLPRLLGGKTYFFFGYEGFNSPQSQLITRQVPTDLLKAGVIQINEGGTAGWVPFNLNPTPVTVHGVTYQPAACNAGACDPLGLGLNPIVSQLWNKFEPTANSTNVGDAHNIEGFQGQISLPTTSKFLVGRVDHDFGDKWRFFGSYRYYALQTLTTNQVDIGGALPGDKFGVPTSRAPRPQKPDFMVAGLTTTINPTTTNDFRINYTRIWWQWATSAAPPQIAGLGGALEIGGESANALVPYNVNNQNTRQRFWDGHDTLIKDDVSKIIGNHIVQFGGNYQRNWDYHLRNDNGQGINTSPVYQIGNQVAGTNYTSATQPAGLPSNQVNNWNKYYSYVLGIVDQPQQLFTRSGTNLMLNPVGTPMFDKDTINFYNLYATDSWHVKPNLTLTYGLSYQVEMPPVEATGKQVELVDSAGHPINFGNYFDTKSAMALKGQVYNPTLGFATIGNVVGSSHKYPFNPFYGGLSPRVAMAWNPKYQGGLMGKLFGDGKTVIRGGYGQIYSRLNGVGLVLLPLLGVGLGQPASCVGALATGGCPGVGGATPATAFRIGTNGLVAPIPTPTQTLPQPYFPGTNGNSAAGSASVLDPNFRPAATYNFNFSIQRELASKVLFETGYIGRIIKHEFQQRDINAVPTMLTLNGESFAHAFAQTYFALAGGGTPAVQPFFEAALGGANSSFCAGFGSCTAAVAANKSMSGYINQTQVTQLWSALSKTSSWTQGRTIPSSPGVGFASQGQAVSINADDSSGSGNYNALYTTLTLHDWHSLTTTSNFTWGRALGTGSESQATSGYTALNPYNVRQSMYGPQFFDYKFIYTQSFLWDEPFFKRSRSLLRYTLGGWRFGAILAARSGAPLAVGTINGDGFGSSFGETQASNTNENVNFGQDGAVLASKYTSGGTAHYNLNVASSASNAGTNGNLSNGGNNINFFSNPAAAYNQFRPCILGYDTSCGSQGQIRGLPNWNVDANLVKDLPIFRERIAATLSFQIINIFNHVTLTDPYLDLSDPNNFGVLGSNDPNNATGGRGQSNNPRQITFNLRVRF